MPVTIAHIKSEICREFGITAAGLTGRSRKKEFAQPRALAALLCRELTTASLALIGREFNRHHATIHSLVKRAHSLMDAMPEHFDHYRAIKRRLDLG